MAFDEIDSMAQQVRELCDRRLSDIRIDLLKTKSAETTINRVFDGTFLEGTSRDPSLKTHIILDSDEEEIDGYDRIDVTLATAERPVSQCQRSIHALPDRGTSSSLLGDPTSSSSPPSNPEYIRRQTSPTSPSPLYDDDNTIPLLLTGPYSSLPTRKRRPREYSPVLLSSSSLPKEPASPLSSSPPPQLDVTSPPLADDGTPPPSQQSSHLSLSPPFPAFTNTLNSNLLHQPSSSYYVPPVATASQGTSIFDPIDLDDDEDSNNEEEDDPNANITSDRLRSAPSTPTTAKQRQAQRNLSDDVMSLSAISSMPLDFLKEWEYSSSDDGDNDDTSVTNTQTNTRKKDKQNEQQPSKSQQRKVEHESRKREKEERKQQEKEAKQRRKEELKAEKEKKKLLEQANRVRNNRQELYSEMILDVDREFNASPRGELLRQVIVPKEAELRPVETMYYTIAWYRKTRAVWDEEQGTFIPHQDNQIRIVQEPKVLVFMEAAEVCDLVQSANRDDRIDRIKRACGDDRQVLLMIEGLEKYYKRKTLLQQRSFEQAVIHNLSGEGSASSSTQANLGTKRKRDALTIMAETGPTREQVEEALTYFQLVKDIMLVPTTDEADSIDWIVALTADIASAIYKDKSRHLRQGVSRCGKDAAETWNKMLQEIQLCTPPVANAVTAAYPNAQSLHQAYNRETDRQERDMLLAEIEVDRGILTSRGRTINNHMSKKICTIFTSDDPSLYIA